MAIYPTIKPELTTALIETAIRESFGSDEQIKQSGFSHIVEKSMNAWTKDIILQMRNHVRDSLNPTRDGSDLAQSIKPTAIHKKGTLKLIDVTANDYWSEMNYGVDGRVRSGHAIPNQWGNIHAYSKTPYTNKPPLGESHADAILKWIPKTGFTKPPDTMDENGKWTRWTYESWAWVIARNIKNRGIKPKQFVEKSLTNEAKKVLSKKLYELTGLHFDVIWNHEAEKQAKK